VSSAKTLPLYELPLGHIFLHAFTVIPRPRGSTSRQPSQSFELELLLGAALELLGGAGGAELLLDPVKLHTYLFSPEAFFTSM
jgi:hypothetical protein